jgi:glycosyltransferase involved in cell wall biosynthesis
MAARLPVVCTAVGDIPEIVAPENAPHIHPKQNEADLAASLRMLLLDADLRRVLGTANRRRVEREFTLDAMCGRYHSIYEKARTGALDAAA